MLITSVSNKQIAQGLFSFQGWCCVGVTYVFQTGLVFQSTFCNCGASLGFHQTNSLFSAVLLPLMVHWSRLIWHLSLVLICAQM